MHLILIALFFQLVVALQTYIPYYLKTPDNVQLAYYDTDPKGYKPALLFVHGVGLSGQVFWNQLSSPLLRSFRIVAFDQRGFGYSEKPFGLNNYTDANVTADDIETVRKQLNLHPVLIGQSAGGLFVLQYLLKYGDCQLKGVGLTDSIACPDQECLTESVAQLKGDTSFGDLVSPNITVALQGQANWGNALGYGNANKQQQLILQSVVQQNPQFVISARFSLVTQAYGSTFSSLKVPLLIQYGLNDVKYIWQPAIKTIASLVRDTTIRSYEKGGHLPFVFDSTAYTKDLVQWIIQKVHLF